MATLLFILEEESMETFLRGARPRLPIPGDVLVHFRVARGWQNLRRLVDTTLRTWHIPNTRFMVLCDQDKADCRLRKEQILAVVPQHRRHEVLVRIVCYELESWYFGDPGTLARRSRAFRQIRGRAMFRNPDQIQQPSSHLKTLTRLGKSSMAEEMGPLLDLDNNRSHSLQVFLSGLQRLLDS